MIPQEDIEPTKFPPLVVTLYQLQRYEHSLEYHLAEQTLKCSPAPTESLSERIAKEYEQLKELQPGFCDECGAWSIRRIMAYWNPSPLFCLPCWEARLDYYRFSGNWPEADLGLDR